MIRPSFVCVCCWVLLSCCLVSCSDRKPISKSPPPAAYYPEQFPDIPLPPGYKRRNNVDQVAISFAGDQIRHFDITLIQSSESSGKVGEKLILWYNAALTSNGWKHKPNKLLPHNAKRYEKLNKGQTELLELRTGRDKNLSIIRLRFVTEE